MSRRIVTDQQRQYLFSPDDEPPPGNRTWAVLRLRIFDELFDQPKRPPRGFITVRSRTPHVTPRVAEDGVAGLVAVPRQAFPALNAQGYPVHAVVEAAGYVAHEIESVIPQQPAFPFAFTPLAWMDVLLHRNPVAIFGRTMRRNGMGLQSVAGARVEVIEISRRLQPSPAVVTYQAANLVSLTPPLFHARQTGVCAIEGRNYSDEKRLVESARPGDGQIVLSDRQNLAVGNTLLVDAFQPDLREQHTINNLSGGLNPGEPVTVTLAAPLAWPHARNSLALKDNGGVAWPNESFAEDALPGDACIFLNNVASVADGYALVTGGPAPTPDEVHQVRRFSVVSDADGYYRLPPLNRVAQAKIHAAVTVAATTYEAEVEFRPDYTQPENQLDLILAP